MDDKFRKSKKFSEILDHTFQLSRNYFSSFLMIFLVLIGPVILLEAIYLMNSGHSFIRQTGVGTNWLEQIANGFDDVLEEDNGIQSMLSFLTSILTVVGTAAVLFAVQQIKEGKDFTPGAMIKKAFSRFGPLLGSSALIGIIVFFIVFAVVFGGGFSSVLLLNDNASVGITLFIILLVATFLGVALLFTRWSFFMAIVTFKEGFPGFGKSWRLTKKNTWRVFGIFLIVFLITGVTSGALNSFIGLLLGDSVVSSILTNGILLVMSIISSVAYAVVYFDLRLKQGGEDLQEMIDDYQKN